MLPGLPRIATDRDITVVTAPRREVIEVRTDDTLTLYVMEPVTVPAGGGGSGGGLVGHTETPAITVPVGPAGTGGAWTLTPAGWRTTVAATAGDVLEWAPVLILGGGPAALDLVCVHGETIVRAASSRTATPATLGSMYTQGDAGTARLPTMKWTVQSGEPLSGVVTLALAYRAATSGEEGLILGHADAGARFTLTNLGAPGGTPTPTTVGASVSPGGGTSLPSVAPVQGTQIYLGTGGNPVTMPDGYHPVKRVAIDVSTLDIYELEG